MLTNANFLCEIGTEEIPAGYLSPAIAETKVLVERFLGENRINFSETGVYATPRRIAIMVSGLAERQREEEAEIKGPSKAAAYAGGKPTKALSGFLAGNRVAIEDVFVKDTGRGEYLFAKKRLEAKNTVEILPALIKEIIAKLSFPKKMRWSDKNISFPRPIAYYLILFNGRVVPLETEGISSSDKTRGHYIQHNKMIEIRDISKYGELLKKNGVIVDHAERKEAIRKELYAAAVRAGGKLNEDEELLDTVTFLVESPYAVACEFEPEYLEVPGIVLIAEMKVHQKYFSVLDGAGKLTNKFLAVSNNPPTPFVKAGNERVIRARFNDARFFYNEDRKKKLADRVDSLKKVLFHKELGSIYDKAMRMSAIGAHLAGVLKIDKSTAAKIDRAVLLCKTDLETNMVHEFTSLQGEIGKIYALHDGEDPEVADAIESHYRPRFHGDILPKNIVGAAVSIAEKIDNIFGSFSVGNIPKGSADPYALRRQANAVVELLISNGLHAPLKGLLEAVAQNYRGGEGLVPKILEFISARVKTILSEQGFSHDEIDACLSARESDFLEVFRRAKSLHEFRKDENFSRMLLGFKRMNNIVSAFRKENADYALKFDPALMKHEAEKKLHEFFESRRKTISDCIASSSYIELFKIIIEGKSIIDGFFDAVLVMDPKVEVRDTRLGILESVLGHFRNLLDFSKIEEK